VTLVEHEDSEPDGLRDPGWTLQDGKPEQAQEDDQGECLPVDLVQTRDRETAVDQAVRQRLRGRRLVVAISLLTNVAAAAAALTGAAVTGSVVLLAVGLLAVADGGAQVGLLAGRWRDRHLRRRSADHHPLDTCRYRLFWLFAPGVVLVTVAGVVAVGAGIAQMAGQTDFAEHRLALWFVGAALVFKCVSLAVAVTTVRRAIPPGMNPVAYLLRGYPPEPAVIARQDGLAVAALVVAAGLTLTTQMTDLAGLDAGGATAIGGLLIVGAVLYVVQMNTMLVANPAGGHERQAITAVLEIEPTVVRLVHLEAYHLGPEELLVGAKVELIADLHASELADTVKRLASNVRRAVPAAAVVYIEPDAPSSTKPDDAGPLPAAGVFGSGGTFDLPEGDPRRTPEADPPPPTDETAKPDGTPATDGTKQPVDPTPAAIQSRLRRPRKPDIGILAQAAAAWEPSPPPSDDPNETLTA
jgi:divalent metal cation (Fe/Co/Zn/Cd) transporter